MVRCFEWRDDETGEIDRQRPAAGGRPRRRVTILKDRVGDAYEHLEATKQSFFHK